MTIIFTGYRQSNLNCNLIQITDKIITNVKRISNFNGDSQLTACRCQKKKIV